MNHCIIMTAYQDPDLINRFISRVPKEWGIYIHIDKKSSIKCSDINQRANVYKWYRVYWGASEHLFAIWRLIQTASKEGNWDYYHIVSGSDYFALNPYSFESALRLNGNNYIDCHPLPDQKWAYSEGMDIFKYKRPASFLDIRKPFGKRVDRLFLEIQRRFNLCDKMPQIPLYHGMVYSSLHKDFIEWAISSSMADSLLKSLRHTIVAEEVFFQTLIMNSPFKCSVINRNLRFHRWEGAIPPRTLLASDFADIQKAEVLFCRKLSSMFSKELISLIDSHILND